MLIRTLSEYEDKFLYYINKWNKELTRYDDTKWFDTDLPWCIQNRYKQYEDWTFVVTDDNEEELYKWYKGPTLLEAIDSFAPVVRNIGKILSMGVSCFNFVILLCLFNQIQFFYCQTISLHIFKKNH